MFIDGLQDLPDSLPEYRLDSIDLPRCNEYASHNCGKARLFLHSLGDLVCALLLSCLFLDFYCNVREPFSQELFYTKMNACYCGLFVIIGFPTHAILMRHKSILYGLLFTHALTANGLWIGVNRALRICLKAYSTSAIMSASVSFSLNMSPVA